MTVQAVPPRAAGAVAAAFEADAAFGPYQKR
eukprot:CAMPEP_0181130356 /NCGR_PEP_ID=MMETSP1071-20121207/29816_1 /TAXON_ID=35127 /ORGANISM="Thalassiosira sp., Strain NH16" /LENGTH=30 /DNA_ID= /DNA_START= /DNA_END= /DNA_ORIENTATION=